MRFTEALEYFRELGYEVEAGPGANETTLIDDQRPDYQSYIVLPNDKLAGMKDSEQKYHIEPFYVEVMGEQIRFDMPNRTIIFQTEDLQHAIRLAQEAENGTT